MLVLLSTSCRDPSLSPEPQYSQGHATLLIHHLPETEALCLLLLSAPGPLYIPDTAPHLPRALHIHHNKAHRHLLQPDTTRLGVFPSYPLQTQWLSPLIVTTWEFDTEAAWMGTSLWAGMGKANERTPKRFWTIF